MSMKSIKNGGSPFEERFLKGLNKRVRARVDSEIIFLTYRKRYNLPPNDPRFLEMTEYEMWEDLRVMNKFEKVIRKEDDDDDDDDEMDDNDTNRIFESKKGDFDISMNYTKKEIDDWFNDDSDYGKIIEDKNG